MDFQELTPADFVSIFRGEADSAAAQEFPCYPPDAPGMPPVGAGFIARAAALATVESDDPYTPGSKGFNVRAQYLKCLYDPTALVAIDLNGTLIPAPSILGHLWNGAVTGPVRPTIASEGGGAPVVMVVGKMPGQEEESQGRGFCGPPSEFFRTALAEAGLPPEVTAHWYMTHLVRWPNVDPKGGALPAKWIKDCLPLLHQEIRLVKPDYIICLGAEATKHVLNGETLKNMAGRVAELTVSLQATVDEPVVMHTAKVVAITHPMAILRATEQYPAYLESLRRLGTLLDCGSLQRVKKQIELRYIYTQRELSDLVSQILAENPGLKKIAVDAEWHGPHPGEPGAYLRTIQFSHKPGFGVVVVLTHPGGGQACFPSQAVMVEELKRLLDRDDVQLGGHFFSADLPWLAHAGLPLIHRFTVPDTVEAMRGGNYAGGFDTALAAHAHDETGELKLESQGVRYCGATRWDVDLQKWKKEYCHKNGLNADELEGYGECPAEILLPYGGEDAVETRELMDVQARPNGLLDRDRDGNSSWIPFRTSMIAFPAFLEMHMYGLQVDRKRVDELTDRYMDVLDLKALEFNTQIIWPEFNHRSAQQCKELLFGEQYSGKRDKLTNEILSVRPEGALSLYLTPIKSTGAKSKPWERIVSEGETANYAPSTDKETLGILGALNPLASQLRDIRFIDQVLKSVLCTPEMDKAGNILRDVNGARIYTGGLISHICTDNRVRSAFLQTMETGRASSKRPALQNISNKRESDYMRILGDRYLYPMRSIFISNFSDSEREKTVFLGADYSGAELLGQATQARDPLMIEHCLRASLPDSDPGKYDIHSNIAVLAFRLSCAPTKEGLKSIGKKHLRIAAKNIIFGIGYGRGAEACARQCQEEGVPINTVEAQQIIDTIFALYNRIPVYQNACKLRVQMPRWMRNAKGRLRRFVPTDDRGVLGELEREALNFPMQSLVADCVSEAMHYLYTHPRREELGYKFVLQLHDAVYLEVPTRSIGPVYHEVLPECMVDRISFRSCTLDGIPYKDSPEYRFVVDKKVSVRWGEGLTADMCGHLGISAEYAHEDGD